MSTSVVPSDWQIASLEVCVDILDSQRVPVNNKERRTRIQNKSPEQLYPYFGATGEVGKIDDYLFDEELVALGEDGVPFLDPRKPKAYLLSGKTWVNNHAHVLRAAEGLTTNQFLLHFLNQFDYQEYVNGGTRLKLTQANMRRIPFQLPSLAEQKVIADKLDTLLAQVENTKARLERIPQIIKRFRQSVMAAAVSGRLTGTPEEKFKIIPIEQLAKPQRYSLGIGPFGSNLKVSDYREAGHPLVFVREIRANQFGDDATKYVSGEKFNELKAHRAVPGDILITKMGDPPGDVAIYPLDRPEAVITADCIKLSVDEPIYCRDYVAYAMQSEQFRRDVLSISAGVAQQKVNLTKFRKLTLRVPPKMEQTEIVRRVDQLFAHADRIEQQVNNALARVNNLTQSILAKAFRGELTEQWRKDNPDLISGENCAEALLERIKAERAALKPAKRARGLSKA